MKSKIFALAIASVMLSACSISQTVEPAHISKQTALCIVENPKVREGFLNTFQATLTERGISHRVIAAGSNVADCPWTAHYTANWTWDLALYMSYAEIKIYRQGELDGEAIYDSTGGGANMSKFINAETKIQELVNKLMQFQSSSLFRITFS